MRHHPTGRLTLATTATLAFAALSLVASGCDDYSDDPLPATGRIEGTVVMVPSEGPAVDPAGARAALYRTRADLDQGQTFRTAEITGTGRLFAFTFEAVAPGQYFVDACFTIGCRPYAGGGPGEPVAVIVQAGRTLQLELPF